MTCSRPDPVGRLPASARAAVATALILALRFGWRGHIGQRTFYLLFSLAVKVSVQLVGVYLVFAMLIVSSLAVRDHRPSYGLPIADAVGALGYAMGLILSAALDLPSGALIVWCLA